MEERLLEPRVGVTLAVIITLVAALLGNSLRSEAEARAPGAVTRSGRVFAEVLGGVRTAAAAYIWIKIDDAGDKYYGGTLKKVQPLVPLYRISTWLDPRLERAYYVGSFVLWREKKVREAIAFAREGVEKNPRSPLLVFNLGQLYMLQSGPEAGKNALHYLSQAEQMTRKADAGSRLEVLSTLNAAHHRFGVAEPSWLEKELTAVRAWVKAHPAETGTEEGK